MKGLVTIFGGSGFVGAQIVRALAREGFRIRVAVRRPGRAYRLPMLGDVGQIEIVQANILDLPSVGRALDAAEACINAVAVLHEAGRQRFTALHVAAAEEVARAAKSRNIQRFVHISALGADERSHSRYGRSKAQGETAVRTHVASAVMIRPAVVFGPGDDFFNRFATMATVSPALPLIGGGATLFQPVFVGDVAAAVASAVRDPRAAGQTYELGGPGVYSFRELMALMLQVIGRRRLLVPVPFAAARVLGFIGQLSGPFITPPITRDQVDMLRDDNVMSPGALGLEGLGVAPSALEPIIPTYLYRYRKGGQYAEATQGAAAPRHG
ncbi:MAG TPA: complex I NDUFA9 subunit family protein [Caulobacteraceae bacterium]